MGGRKGAGWGRGGAAADQRADTHSDESITINVSGGLVGPASPDRMRTGKQSQEKPTEGSSAMLRSRVIYHLSK